MLANVAGSGLELLRVIRKPQLLTVCATDATSAPTTAAGLFMAKYTPGSITEAATMAMMATNDSISMPP